MRDRSESKELWRSQKKDGGTEEGTVRKENVGFGRDCFKAKERIRIERSRPQGRYGGNNESGTERVCVGEVITDSGEQSFTVKW